MQLPKIVLFVLIQCVFLFIVIDVDAKTTSKNGNIRGQLVYRCNDKPANVPYYIVLFDDSDNPSNTITKADSKGKFSFTGLNPGSYTLVYDDTYRFYVIYTHADATVEIRAGETSSVEIEITLCPNIKLLSPISNSAINKWPLVFEWQNDNSNNKKEYRVVIYDKNDDAIYLPLTTEFTSKYYGELKPGKEVVPCFR